MSSDIIDLTVEVFLPEDIKQSFIPLDGLPVPHLFSFTKYPPLAMPYYDHLDFSELLHGEELTGFNPDTLLQYGPPPQNLSEKYKVAIKAASHAVHSFALVPLSGDPVRFPVWVLDYWREIRRAVEYRRDWKGSLVWLRGMSQSESMIGICEQVMAGLSCFPWNGNNCSVHDMVSILSNSWLSDFHIDYVVMKMSNRFQAHYGAEASSHHIFLPVMDLTSVVRAYNSGAHSGSTGEKRKQFLKVENDIIQGSINTVAGVLHLPNHWTSLIIEFKPPRIFFGDSLGNPMPASQVSSFQQWILHMLRRSGQVIQESDISVFPLETTLQQDQHSCSLLALNALEHHYFQQDTPLLQPDNHSLAYYRMKIALGLLQEDTVSDSMQCTDQTITH
jgi:hypothetical protein